MPFPPHACGNIAWVSVGLRSLAAPAVALTLLALAACSSNDDDSLRARLAKELSAVYGKSESCVVDQLRTMSHDDLTQMSELVAAETESGPHGFTIEHPERVTAILQCPSVESGLRNS